MDVDLDGVHARLVVEPAPEDEILEIGPGLGSLTRRLVERARHVWAVEVDPKLVAKLRGGTLGSNPALELIEGDILELPLESILPERKIKLVNFCPRKIEQVVDKGRDVLDAILDAVQKVALVIIERASAFNQFRIPDHRCQWGTQIVRYRVDKFTSKPVDLFEIGNVLHDVALRIQAEVLFRNIHKFMELAGGTPENIAHMTVFLQDEKHRESINKAWIKMFPDETNAPIVQRS